MPIDDFSSLVNERSYVEILKSLIHILENIVNKGLDTKIQCALFDVAEYITTYSNKLCSKNVAILVELRPLFISFENIVDNLIKENKIDKRLLQIFLNNTIGSKKFFVEGAVGSIFRKTKSKIFRAVDLTWEEREKSIENMVKDVPERRRRILILGRAPVRGYSEMSDRELWAWAQFSKEIHEE